ncbi:uncharacterized protein EI97DRAFT_460640 [Westerdykella ornata]|uniref:Uncharacterized protein n=1 Tax=Westerdykella ornata TaxID=318751 RepID=A0A6A6JCQ8_WESOR|nr:uncharacterized protein EI97DRAFT_460640 [Westerdykella ornata]KAF2273963.1 hypothetical protein EI97DRAFT_460640 [Westerdykella ornata]
MFNNLSGGLLAGQYDCNKERPPPSRPVPASFPSLSPPQPSLDSPPRLWAERSPSPLAAHFLDLKKPSDVKLETLKLLNVSIEPPCDFETLLPSTSGTTGPFLPPRSWLEPPNDSESGAPTTSATPASLLSNGRKVPTRNDFYARAQELLFNNADAFAALTRKPLPGQVRPRLAHFRKFWEGLDNWAYYWDDSLDEYLPPKQPNGASSSQGADANPREAGAPADLSSPSTNLEEPRKKMKTETTVAAASEPPALPGLGESDIPLLDETTMPVQQKTSSISSSASLPARTVPPKLPWATNIHAVFEAPVDLSNGSYRGYRIGNGPEMPDQYRLECVRGFLEGVAWAFGVIFAPHRRPPVLCLEHVRFPVRMNTAGWRAPSDRMKARQGWLEGPLIGIQCRPETSFGTETDAVLDVARELGGLLLLAQERAREGRTETKAGEGKWWTTKPRWGGGPGGEIGEAAGASDAPAMEPPAKEEKPSVRMRLGQKDRKKPSPAEVWKVLKPGNPLWDPRIVYEAIGKETDSDWDEVFMVSSLNHHISILKLRVHRLYLRFLEEGTLPEHKQDPSDLPWFSPSLQRTKWFDLFKVEDRTEAMRGLWGIMHFLMQSREKTAGSEDAMKGA